MRYIEVYFNLDADKEFVADVLSAQLGELGFESFVSVNNGLKAYVPQPRFSEQELQHLIDNFILDADISYSFNLLEDKNWNEEWEKHYFQPIVIENKCVIHSSFHHIDKPFEYRILIDPKMSFGTGHHQTTGLILKEILSMDLSGKSVLDMGCGTAVLAILASLKGAGPITAIDIDEWAYNNALENVRLNDTNNVEVLLGGAELLGSQTYDVIFANINRNILLQYIPAYTRVLNNSGILIMSGFYKEDIPVIRAKSEENGLAFHHASDMDNWAAVTVRKNG